MVRMRWPYEGQVLNRWQGEPTAEGLRIAVRGTVDGTATVTVNGQPAAANLGEWTASVLLRPGRNEVVAEAAGGLGRGRHGTTIWYDQHGLKRYRFSVDDNSFWLRELARQATQYPSLFDLWYLRLWRDLHQRYGLRVVLNSYWETADGFTLADFPDQWRSEFEASADWLKLSWHARANLPDRPYEYAGHDQVAADFDQVRDQILRFAGEATWSPPTVVHWAEVTRAGMQALVDRGVRNLSGIFRPGSGRLSGVYHLRDERADAAAACSQWIDSDTGIAFSKIDLIVNNTPLERVAPALDAAVREPEGVEILDLFTHEQYFWPFYERHVPDHAERVEAAVRWATEHGYQPCWFHEGYLGGPEIR